MPLSKHTWLASAAAFLLYLPSNASLAWQGQPLDQIQWSDRALQATASLQNHLATPIPELEPGVSPYTPVFQSEQVSLVIDQDFNLYREFDQALEDLHLTVRSVSGDHHSLWAVSNDGLLYEWHGDYFELSPFNPAQMGGFHIVTYNTAGLPSFVKGFSAERNLTIGTMLNDYDIALVQEDFVYHKLLTRHIELPFQTQLTPEHNIFRLLKKGRLTLDGLHRFSSLKFTEYQRNFYSTCFGILRAANDCLAFKGYTTASTHLSEQTAIMVINTHLEAGGSTKDIESRIQQLRELKEGINASIDSGQAGIVAGDWNLNWNDPDDAAQLDQFLADLPLHDVSETHASGDLYYSKIDRIFYWNSPGLTLTPIGYADEDERYRDETGAPLSDHSPVSATFIWANATGEQNYNTDFVKVEVLGPRLIRVEDQKGRQYLGTFR